MSHEIFSWKEVGRDESSFVVEIIATERHIQIDAATRDAMIAVQEEILAAFPPHSVKLLIDVSLFEVKFGAVKEVTQKQFIEDLLKLSQDFNRLIVHSGSGAVSLVISTIKVFESLTGVRVERASNRDRALEIARKPTQSKKTG